MLNVHQQYKMLSKKLQEDGGSDTIASYIEVSVMCYALWNMYQTTSKRKKNSEVRIECRKTKNISSAAESREIRTCVDDMIWSNDDDLNFILGF